MVDLRVERKGLVRGPLFARILAGDALFTILNTGAAVWTWLAGGPGAPGERSEGTGRALTSA